MNAFALVVDTTIVLTAAVVVMSLGAIAKRIVGDFHEARIRHQRHRVTHSLAEFFGGALGTRATIGQLRRYRLVALDVMIDHSAGLARAARTPLRGLFEALGFVDQEIAGLRSRQWPRRLSAATRLGYMDSSAAVTPLAAALDDEMLDVRLAAARSLAELQSAESTGKILRALALPGAWPLQRCAEILHSMGAPAVKPLLDFLAHEATERDTPAIAVCVRVLGMLRVRQADGAVSSYLNSTNAELRLAAAKALGEIGIRSAVGPLCDALRDRAWEVRSAAALALGRLGDPAAVLALQHRLSDPAWWVRFNAAQSLFRLGAPGRQVLESAMIEHADGFARDIGRQVLEEQGVPRLREAMSA